MIMFHSFPNNLYAAAPLLLLRRHVTPRTIQPLGLGFLYSVVKILKLPTGVHRPPGGQHSGGRRYVGKLPREGAQRSGNGAGAERERERRVPCFSEIPTCAIPRMSEIAAF